MAGAAGSVLAVAVVNSDGTLLRGIDIPKNVTASEAQKGEPGCG